MTDDHDLRFALCGGSSFAGRCLEGLVEAGADVVGLVALRGETLRPADFVDLAAHPLAASTPTHRTDEVNAPETLRFLRERRPDLLLVSWPRLLAPETLATATFGAVGTHWSLLPANRGRHPLHWALALGLDRTGLTFFRLDEGVDTGPIVHQTAIPIGESDYISDLVGKLHDAAAPGVRRLVEILRQDPRAGRPQDAAGANTWRKRTPDDCRIDLRMSAKAIYDLVRSYSHPFPGATLRHGGIDHPVYRSEVVRSSASHHEPGRVEAVEAGAVVVKAGEDAIRLFAEDVPFLTALAEGDYLG